jgi:RNA polymerase sigma-70 factor (ECF subfamily)
MSAITTFIEGEPAVCGGVFGDRSQELDCVVSRYLPMFYKRALRFLGNAPDAEDAVQDALLSAYRHLGQFRGQAQLSTWLMTIVTNAALMQLRRRHNGYFSLDQEQGEEGLTFSERLTDSKPSPEEVCSIVEARNRLVEGVQRLSPKLRRAFQLRDIDGLTTKEAARALGVPEGTVKARLARARAKLAGIMRGSLSGSGPERFQLVKRSPRKEPQRKVETSNFYDNSNQLRNFSFRAAQDGAQRKGDSLPRYKAVFRAGF